MSSLQPGLWERLGGPQASGWGGRRKEPEKRGWASSAWKRAVRGLPQPWRDPCLLSRLPHPGSGLKGSLLGVGLWVGGDHASLSDKQSCVRRQARPASSTGSPRVSIPAPAVGCPAGGDSGARIPTLDSRALWAMRSGPGEPDHLDPLHLQGRPRAHPDQADVRCRTHMLQGRSRPENSPLQPALPARPRLLPLHGCHLVRSVAFGGLSSSSSLAIGRGGVGHTCFPSGRVGRVCGLGLVTGRRWLLVEGLDQACARQGHQSGLLLQQGHMSWLRGHLTPGEARARLFSQQSRWLLA